MYPHQSERLTDGLDRAGLDALIATSSESVAYVTGFRSPTDPVLRAQRFGVFCRRGTALVVPDSDVAAALDGAADVDHLVCYGRGAAGVATPRDPGLRRIHGVLAAAAASPYDALAGALARLGVGPGPVGLDAAGLGHGEWLATGERLAGTRLVPAEAVLAAARRVKSPYELECLGRALRVVEEALDAVIQSLERGTTEREAATQYAAEAVKRGAAQCLASVLFGERTWMGIAPPSDRALRPGDLVRLDVGALHKGYWASVARTAVLGEPASSIGSAYLALQAALGAATAALRAGAATRSVLESAAAAVREHGAAAGEWVCAGHGIGLAAREAPDLDGAVGALEAGEVLCVELAGREIGSRGLGIRNTALVTTAGGRSLNHSRDDMVALD